MNDNDLIRRGDARQILEEEGFLERSLANLAAIPAAEVAVKQLEWDDFCRNSFTAQSPFGDYVVELHDGDGWGMWTPDEGELAPDAHSWHQTEESAKAAAQADYDPRIRSALTISTIDPAKVQALVDAASDALAVLEEYNLGASSPVMCDLISALAAWKEG